MSTTRVLLAVLSIGLYCTSIIYPGTNDGSDQLQTTKTLQEMVDNLLKGRNIEQTASKVDGEAYLVDGKYFESLAGVLNGESKHCKLIEGPQSKTVHQYLRITDNLTAAFMIVQTQTPNLGDRYHSVMFLRDVESGWKIQSWHISN